jgi:Fe-S cluster assembly ATPase SufC
VDIGAPRITLLSEPARFEGLGVMSFILAGRSEKSRAVAVRRSLKWVFVAGKVLMRAVDKTLSGGERKRTISATNYR